MKLKRYFLNIRNWPEQLILSNLSDGNSLNVMSNFQYYPLTLISSKIFPSPPLKPFLKKKKGEGGGSDYGEVSSARKRKRFALDHKSFVKLFMYIKKRSCPFEKFT